MSFLNPSKIITDVLSKYLEFDPEQLKLGIWSGNLSIQDVELKREAMYPLLNDTTSSLPKHDGKPPLNLKLVKGTVGDMKIRIPWKRLVWGQGDVKLHVSDVTIAVAYESREETSERNLSPVNETNDQEKEEAVDDEEEKKKKREWKQQWLREAERCQLQGIPLPTRNDILKESEEQASGADGQTSTASSMNALDRWLQSTTETFAWRFAAGIQASIRNVRIVIVQDGVEIGTIFHSMDVVPGILNDSSLKNVDQSETDPSGEVSILPSAATPPPDVVPEGGYDDGEHLDKTVKLQGFGVFVRNEDKSSKSPKTFRFSSSVSADDYVLLPTEANLSISIFDPYPPGKQKKKKIPAIEEEPPTPITATATVDSATSSKSRRSKREKRPLLPDDGDKVTVSTTPGPASENSERPAKQPRSALRRPERMSSTRQFSISELPASGNRLKSHTVDFTRGTSSGELSKEKSIEKAELSRGSSIPTHQRKGSAMSGKSIPLLPSEGLGALQPAARTVATPPSLDFQLSFGDVKTVFSSRHYQLLLTLKSTVERMKNGRPDKTIASCFGELGMERKRSVYVDAPTSIVKNIDDPLIASQLAPSALVPIPRPSSVQRRAQTTGGVDFLSGETTQRVKLHLQLELPSSRDKNQKVVRAWWQYAYSAVLYDVRKRRYQESTFDRKHVKFDWEKEKYNRKEYVDLYVASRLEPSSVLRSVELKVKLGSKSPEEELLKMEDELPVEQILLYRSIARSLRVRGMKKMPASVLDLHGENWLKIPNRKKAVKATELPSVGSNSSRSRSLEGEARETQDGIALPVVAAHCTDINGIRRQADAVRMRTSASRTSRRPKMDHKKQLHKDIEADLRAQHGRVGGKNVSVYQKNQDASTKEPPTSKLGVTISKVGEDSDGLTVRTFKTTKTSQTKPSLPTNEKDSQYGLRVSTSITFSNVELTVYEESKSAGDSSDSMRFRLSSPAWSANGAFDKRVRSTVGLHVLTHDSSSSDVSDVSILSDDQLFFDQNEDVASVRDGETDVPIMSSADFLMLNLPRDVLLRVTVSGLVAKMRGQNGSQQMISLVVENVTVDGDEECHFLSLTPKSVDDCARPLEEVHINKQKRPPKKKITVSFTELEVLHEHAILVSIVSKEIGSQLQCDLCKAVATIDLLAYSKIYNFFSTVQVALPRPLIEPTQVNELREDMVQHLAATKASWRIANEGVTCAFRLQGLEITLPGPNDGDSLSGNFSGSSLDDRSLSGTLAKATLSLKLIEYYDGSLFEDILSRSNYTEEGSWMTNDASLSKSDKSWQRRHLSSMHVSKVLDGRHPASSEHSVFSVTGIECCVSTTLAAAKAETEYNLLDLPVDVEVLLTKNELADFLTPRPTKQISVDVTPIRAVLSAARVDILSRVVLSLSNIGDLADSTSEKTTDTLPRLAALSIQVQVALELRLSSLRLTCVEDSNDLRPSEAVREIIMEESLSDFVAVLSCFNLDYPTIESVEVAGTICVDRLVVLGLSQDEAHDCVHAARLNFLDGIEALKQSQSNLLKEYVKSTQEMRVPEFSSDDDGIPVDVDSIPSVKEISDDGSEESFEILETTLRGAVEKTMSSFSSLLQNSSHDVTSFSDFLIVDLPSAVNLSVTKMFYDFRLECHFNSLNVRNPAGTHLLRFKCPNISQVKDGGDLNSSTAAADSWADDHGSPAVSFSFFALDKEYNFGEGGLPLSVLGSHESSSITIQPRQREQLHHLVFGQIEVFFACEPIVRVIQSMSRLMASIQNDGDVNDKTTDDKVSYPDNQVSVVQSNLYACALSGFVTLASDELVPFCQVEARDFTIDNAMESNESSGRPSMNFVALSLVLRDLTPEGYGYPEILSPMALNDISEATGSLVAHYFPSPDKWKEPSKANVELRGTRLFLVRRFLNELEQYAVSKEHGVGRFLDKVGYWEDDVDAKGNRRPPFQYQVSLVDCSVVLPRGSTNIDMVALEVEKITLFNGFAVSSFRLPTATTKLEISSNVVYQGGRDRSMQTQRSGDSTSENDFFDCLDPVDTLGNDASSFKLSSFKNGWIKRISISLEKGRVFTNLPSGTLSNRGDVDPLIHKFYCLKGKAVQDGPVYTKRHAANSALQRTQPCEKPIRFWREITSSECSLEIVADFVPHLRLLLTDRVIQRDSCAEVLPMNLDMRLSDLCLLLSVWYSNMQELPVMFPYAPTVVEAASRATKPSVAVPEYGTEEYIHRLKNPSRLSSEIALLFDALSFRGSFDEPGYFAEDPRSLQLCSTEKAKSSSRAHAGLLAFKVALADCVLRMTSDIDGILRLACGASSFGVHDERRRGEFETVFIAGEEGGEEISKEDDSGTRTEEQLPPTKRRAWADLSWGLDNNCRTLSGVLPQPFQVSLFMTPGWCLTNLGFEHADAILADLSPIWILVDYFASYFSSAAYGSPVFEVADRKDELKSGLRGDWINDVDTKDQTSMNMDFRLWLLHPCICVPGSLSVSDVPCLSIDCATGFWYHYRSVGTCSLQEMGSTDLSLRFLKEFHQPAACRSSEAIESDARTLIDGFSFGLRMNVNSDSKHTDYVFRMPLYDSRLHDPNTVCSVSSPEYDVKPIVLPLPTVCIPYVEPTRELGSYISEVTIYLEVLPIASSLLQNLVSGPVPEVNVEAVVSGGEESRRFSTTESTDESSFALVAHIDSFRVFAIDPVLEKHLPVALVCVSPLEVNVSKLRASSDELVLTATGIAFPDDLQVTMKLLIWADYFKLGTTRSWEPLLEPFRCLVLYEMSKHRGHGLTFDSEDAFHLNITGSLLLSLDENITSFSRAISEIFGNKRGSNESRLSTAPLQSTAGACVYDQLHTGSGHALRIRHEIPKPIPRHERIAFSFRNLTGQKIRIHQLMGPGSSKTSKSAVTYLDHRQTTTLSFDATISVIRNLNIVEVPFPGLQEANRVHRGVSLADHEVDIQLPGFRWLPGISVNMSGRKFDSLVPVSPGVLQKVQSDWRLQNTMKILTEVGVENGGRLIAARSLFEIRNKTSHSVFLNLNPDPTKNPGAEMPFRGTDNARLIEPGASFQIPALLVEASLELEGHHLGSFWIRPIDSKENKDLSYLFVQSEETGRESVVEYSSRPIQLAKLVHESALIFKSNGGEDLEPDKVRSGVQVSCPVTASSEGEALAPFCYVIEVRRSPLVKSMELPNVETSAEKPKQDKTTPLHFRGGKSAERGGLAQVRAREGHSQFIHGPVSYSLIIHPPFVIENLLPKRGRFELMHATRRTVLWFADLNPGERIPIHTVGLDAPLLLMVNLGFCRTPSVGDGALVHHGSDTAHAKGLYNISHGGLKSIGKAVTKGTKQFGKAVTAIAESPDKRGQGKLFLIQNSQFAGGRGSSKSKKKFADVRVEGNPLGIDTGVDSADGRIHGIEHEYFDPADVVDETVVVDSVGQRLTLKIENVRGGGGQRRISLFCPLWIVNTTEHALTYKQEKGASFVSGTVVSPTKDGSKPVDDSDRNYISDDHAPRGRPMPEILPSTSQEVTRRSGIFAGTPGALATAPGCELLKPEAIISLLDKDLPLETLSEVAFMFNFQLDILSIFKLCVQLSDGTGQSQYSSAWSQGFSLDSVGVNQIVSMPCKDGRALEVSMTLTVAPGLLSGYTKIVRFTPRFVLVNYLERPVRLWQDSSLLHPLHEGMDSPTVSSEHKRSNWHFKDANDPSDAVNQYEYLFGRPAALDEQNIDGIPPSTTANKTALYITTAGTSDIVPFHLPDTRGERQLRVDLGGSWNLSSSFSADATGDNLFKITRAIDSRLLSHVATRASPQYKVILPPPDDDDVDPWDCELGVWFETDWGGDRRIIVQGIKQESYAFKQTDIHVGDELLRVDDFNVSEMTFAETMKVLKEKLVHMSVDRKSAKPKRRASAIILRRSKKPSDVEPRSSNFPETKVVLTFRTLEERLRKVRIKALKARRVNAIRQQNSANSNEAQAENVEVNELQGESSGNQAQRNIATAVKVDMRVLHHSAFVVVQEPDLANPPFRIENRAMNHVVFFRQRSCSSYPWNQVMPGETLPYTWEEPLRVKKLVVRVGPSDAILPVNPGDADSQDDTASAGGEVQGSRRGKEKGEKENETKRLRSRRLRQLFSTQYVKNEEEGGLGASVSVKLEVIGFKDVLPCPSTTDNLASSPNDDDYLKCYVDTDGVTRVLIITDKKDNVDETTEIRNHVTLLQQQIQQEETRNGRLQEIRQFIGGDHEMPVSLRLTTDIDIGEESKHEVTPPPHGASRTDPLMGACSSAVVPNATSDSIVAHNDSFVEEELQHLAEFPEEISITRCNQVYIEVLEAAGLRSSDASGMCNPYCEVVLKERSKSRKSFRSKAGEKQMTYYIENTTTPKWATQVFIFNISPEAVHATRGYAVRVRLRNFHWVGNHPNLGQTSVYLSTLRNQQELVGWYPLVGMKDRSDVDDSLGNYGRGSVRLRMQWIHSFPGLLDYFMMLSERRLANLRQSVDGMKEQLVHAIETERTREQYADTLGSFPIPESLGLGVRRKGRQGSGHLRESREDFDDDTRKGKLGRSLMFHLRDNLRKSRNLHLWQLDSETIESKKRRRSLSEAKAAGLEDKDLTTDEGEKAPIHCIAMIPDVVTRQESHFFRSEMATSSGENNALSQRGRAFSVPARTSSQSRVVFRDDSGVPNPDILEFSRLVRGHSLGNASSEGQSSIVFDVKNSLQVSEINADWTQLDETLDALVQRGFLHHRGKIFLYQDHLVYHFRPLLVDPPSGNTHSSLENFRAKSMLRLSPVVREFRSWTTAQAVFNDDELTSDIVNNTVYIKIKSTPDSSRIAEGEETLQQSGFEGSELVRGVSAGQAKLPRCMPSSMRRRAKVHAGELMNSRSQFERACKRSLRAVLNPGGCLTIRPMTALYLPDSCTGMFVKLRYGSAIYVSETVDAKVSPTWTRDTSVQVTPYAHILTSPGSEKNVFEFGGSDLSVRVDSQRTSGSLRLSVIGERLNKSKVVLGVLQIPIGAAINCCVECMDEVHEEEIRLKESLQGGSVVPAYVRWFPLMSPKDTVAVDGDLGLSSRPSESEKVRDNMFIQYFNPCIKLAFIWQPNEETTDGSGALDTVKPTFDAVALPESPIAETYCNAHIGRFSFALIDSQRAVELVSLYITEINVRFSVTTAITRTALFLGYIQIDYQADNAGEPVVLAPTPSGDSSQPTLLFLAVKDNLRSKSNITSYEYVLFALREMDLTLEESWMFELWDFFVSIMRRIDVRDMVTFGEFSGAADTDLAGEWAVPVRSTPRGSLVEEQSSESTLASLLEKNAPTDLGKKKMYIGQLALGFVKINLSYLKGKRQNWEVNERGGLALREAGGGLDMTGITIGAGGMILGRHDSNFVSPTYQRWSERTQDEDLWTETEVKYSNLPKTIASVFPSVSDAPIRLQHKSIENVFESPDEIFNSIKNYYQGEILTQIYKIIGALDFMGNPSMVLTSFVTGVRDFFITPSKAFLRTPSDPSRVGMGVAKGTLSLFSHSASGVFGFISKMSASAGQVVALLSLDDEFQQWHSNVIVAEAKGLNRQWKRRGVQSVPMMVARPLYDVVRGLALGATGVIVSPYVGAKRRGCAGFAKGVAAGTVGIVAKPVVGVFDAFSHASGSIYSLAKSVNVLEKRYRPPKKVRLSYSFGPKGVLMPYDKVAARCVRFLETHPMKVSIDRADNIRALGDEIHVASEVLPMEPGVQSYVVASSHRIVLFQLKKESGGDIASNLRWQVDLTRASSVTCKLQNQGHNGLALIISTTDPKKKVRIAKGNQAQTSPERKAKAPTLDVTPAADDTLRHSQLSLHDYASQVSTSLGKDFDDDDHEVSELFGNDVSDMEPLVDDKRGFDPDYHAQETVEKGGEDIEWYTIMAEYQQGRQLTRIHNAICCIIGDFDGVMSYRSGSREGSTEGLTSFGELHFGKGPLPEAFLATPRYDKSVCEDLNVLHWMYDSMFRTFNDKTRERQQKILVNMRENWLLSREVSAALEDGTHMALVDTRARSTFIPHAPPSLPATISDGDEVVSAIVAQLKEGHISYVQACDLIDSHEKSVMPLEDASEVSSVTEGNDLALDQLFSSALDKDQSGLDAFYSTTPKYSSGQAPSETRVLDSDDRVPSLAASEPGGFHVSRSPLAFLDAVDSSELRSLAEKSLELQSLAGKSLKSSHDGDGLVHGATSLASLPLNASRGTLESMLPSSREHQPLRPRTESAPAGLAVPKPPHPLVPKSPQQRARLSCVPEKTGNLVPSTGYQLQDSLVSPPDNATSHSSLVRLESMLEQLIIMNARQLGNQDGFQTGPRDEPEMIALRQEIADLRAQVQLAITDGSRQEMIAALRKEVSLLKNELNAEKTKKEGVRKDLYAEKQKNGRFHEADHVMDSQSEGGVADSTGVSFYREQLNRARPAAVQLARGLEDRGASVRRRLNKKNGMFSNLEETASPTTIVEEDERDVSSF